MGKQSDRIRVWRWFCVSLLLCLCIPVMCSAGEQQGNEDWMKTVYNEDNGLPTGEANAVLQTQDGYIWIGSYGGLIRYDGVNFRNFSVQDGLLESSSIRALHEGADGTLYVGTNDMGVYAFQNGTFTRVVCEEDSTFYSVRSFAETSDGIVYVGTTSGLARIDRQEDREYLIVIEDTKGHIVYDLACDKNDRIWACSDGGQLLVVDCDQVCMTMDDQDWMQDECYCVLAGTDGFVYLGSSKNEVVRLSFADDRYEEASFSGVTLRTGGLSTINQLYEDTDGTIWVMADNGLGCIEPEAWKDGGAGFRIPSVMKNLSSVCAMQQDYEGNLWIASSRMGICYFSHGKYSNFNQASGLSQTTVNAIEQYEGRSYIGTDNGLVILGEDYAPISNELTGVLRKKRVRHITCTEKGILWFSLYGDGLVEYQPKTEKIHQYTADDGLLSNQVRMTLALSDGSLAVAGSSGIDILEDGKVVRSYGEKELPYPFILCMFETEDGTLVAGSDGMGIYTIRDSQVKQYYRQSGLDSGIVMRMVPDEDAGGVWVSAGNSLYFWEESGIRRMPFHNEAGSVLDIQLIGEELWLMKSNGPILVEKEKLQNGIVAKKELSKEYGLTGTLVANSWNYLAEDGCLWLCTNNGISVIQTREIPQNRTPPRGAVTQLVADGETYDLSEPVRIPAAAKRITLDLAVMSYTLADKSVEYYLEGFDEEKLQCGRDGLSGISYTNLEGGDYVFHMTVYNEDGVEGGSYTLPIHKEYHFWELGWVHIMLLLAFVLVLAAFIAVLFRIRYRVKINRLKKRQVEYRSIIEQSLHTFANAIDAKDKDTNGHSGRVAVYAREIARRMKLPEEDQETIYYMALLHDIGKIGIPDSILKKNGKLTEEEWEIVRSHPRIGGEILKDFTAIPGIADGVKYHHEFYNGKGYCEGLKGVEIPLTARIIAVADAFDAMCSRRYYHEGSTIEYARAEIIRCSGEQFDPRVAKYMIDMIDEGFMKDKMAEK